MLFFAHGPTATGKSSKLEAIRGVLGEYAATADFETFLKRHGDAGIRNDVRPARRCPPRDLVEVDDGKALAEGLLKLLTGGDTVAARFLYRERSSSARVFKFWLAANDRPRVNADDDAMWRRILQLPFTNVIPRPNATSASSSRFAPTRPSKQRSSPGPSRAASNGSRMGSTSPLRPRLHDAYRAENDPLSDWLADCCELDPAAWTTNAALREHYEPWCETNGEKPVTAKKLGTLLDARGYPYEKSGGTRGRQGIRVN